MDIEKWILDGAGGSSLGDADDKTRLSKPRLSDAYAVYLSTFAPIRPTAAIVGDVADFVEVMRQNEKTVLYSDEEWVKFFVRFTHGDEDVARGMWDALVCQP